MTLRNKSFDFLFFYFRFLEFGRGKSVPLTPDNDNLEQIRIKSNTGRIIVDKTISDLGLNRSFYGNDDEISDNSRYVIDKNGKIVERKKKSRLYSLGGNEPKKSHLVRMKTVGTFDLCMEMTAALACGFNQDFLAIPEPQAENEEIKTSAALNKLESEDEKVSQTDSNSISPKRQRHISSSENSLTVDDSSIHSNTKKRFRSLSSNLCLEKRDSNEFRCKSVDLLDSSVKTYDKDFNDILAGAASTSGVLNKSESNIYESFKDEEIHAKTGISDEINTFQSSTFNLPLRARRRTFKKSKKIVRTDSEMFKEQILSNSVEAAPRKTLQASNQTSTESSDKPDMSSKNVSIDTVFSDMCEEEQIDLEKLEIEYKDHVKSNLQREYKSDGDTLDEAGKDGPEWRNQSVDFEFLETDTIEELRLKSCSSVKGRGKKIRNDSESRSKSEGDKDTLYLKADSTETQSTEDENKIENVQSGSESNKVEKHQSLFEKRFGKLKKMNKLLKVKRFSTSALYDKRKASEAPVPKPKEQKETQPPALAALSQVTDFTSSKTSLASPKSLKGKRFMMKKRKFSFFGKSQSNTDLNISLKSIASKLSLLSKSNFDLSKHSSNLRLNAVGIYGRYSTDYRSDIITKQHGCTSPLSEAFYNATGSYQLTPMELFEKFCSQDFTGLYKHEPLNEDPEIQVIEAGNHSYKGAIKKSSSLRKTTLLKQNSEPKFNIKNYQLDQYFSNPHEVFEEEEIDEAVENEEDEYLYNMNNVQHRRSSYGRQLEFDQNDQYYESNEDKFYENPEMYENAEEDIDEIFLMPGKHRYDGRYSRNSDDILAIDETDEEILEDSEELLDEIDSSLTPSLESDQGANETLVFQENEDFSEVDMNDSNLKTIISEYVKNACASTTSESIARSNSMDLLSNSSDTMKTNSNSEYAFDTVKQIHFDSCSTSKLSLSLNSDIFDDITLAPPLENTKPIKICEMENFTLTPDGSMSENNNAAATKVSEQEKIQNELHSQYTIIDCDELEHDDEGELQRFNDEKSSFAEALNKEFDKLFTRAINDSDTDITTTPSGATVLTAIKLPSRCSMEKLEALPFEFDQENCIAEKIIPSVTLLSQSMTANTLHQSVSSKKDESLKSKSKRSHSLGAITKKKSNKCTPL